MARDFDLAKLLTDNGLRTTVDVDVSFDSGTLFVDADTNRVGIATTTPSYNLEVNGSLNSTSLYIGGTQVTSTATELNLLDGVTATTTELNYTDGVTSNIQTQLDAKAPLASPTFTGTPLAPTAAAATNTTQIATTAFVQTAVSNLVDAAPSTLDTLNELAAALGDDANFSTTVTNSIATKVPLAGGTMTGALNFGDSVKAQFGASQDLQIYHDGSNSYVQDSGTGNLNLKGTNLALQSSTGTLLYGFDSGAVNVYYNNALKLATTSTGIDVTGTVTADGLTVDGNVGIAVTPENWTSTYTALQIRNGASVIGSTDNSFVGIGANAYLDSVDARYEYINTDYATQYYQVDGMHVWRYAPSGTADTAITWSEGMRLDASGRLMVGKNATGLGNAGVELDPAGQLKGTAANVVVQYLNRTSSDGTILEFRKDNTTVGSIGTSGGDIWVNSNTTGLTLDDTNLTVSPRNAVSSSDGTLSLGRSAVRWKDLYLSGNITVGGTVDGRDIATDGTKLDGIESGATADQTASEILTAIKTVDGTGSGLDADTLDGQQGSYYYSPANPPSVSSTFDGLTAKTSGTGTYQTSGDFRAPIFYDSDNTSYYVNPASTSTLRGLDVAANDATDAAYHRAAIEVREYNFGGAQTDSWAYAPRIGMHWGSRVASQIGLASNGRIHILNNPADNNEDLQCDNFYSVNMYDKDNTAYYIDAHATSNINRLILDGRIPLMWHSRGETSTTTNRSLTSTYVTHLSLGGVVVPSGYTGYIFIEVNMGNNYENGNGQYTYRIQATGPATLYSQDHDGGWGYHNNFNPRSTKIFRMTLSTAGTYTLNLQAVLATGSVTLNQYNSIDYLGYELFIQRN